MEVQVCGRLWPHLDGIAKLLEQRIIEELRNRKGRGLPKRRCFLSTALTALSTPSRLQQYLLEQRPSRHQASPTSHKLHAQRARQEARATPGEEACMHATKAEQFLQP